MAFDTSGGGGKGRRGGSSVGIDVDVSVGVSGGVSSGVSGGVGGGGGDSAGDRGGLCRSIGLNSAILLPISKDTFVDANDLLLPCY